MLPDILAVVLESLKPSGLHRQFLHPGDFGQIESHMRVDQHVVHHSVFEIGSRVVVHRQMIAGIEQAVTDTSG